MSVSVMHGASFEPATRREKVRTKGNQNKKRGGRVSTSQGKARGRWPRPRASVGTEALGCRRRRRRPVRVTPSDLGPPGPLAALRLKQALTLLLLRLSLPFRGRPCTVLRGFGVPARAHEGRDPREAGCSGPEGGAVPPRDRATRSREPPPLRRRPRARRAFHRRGHLFSPALASIARFDLVTFFESGRDGGEMKRFDVISLG